MRTSNKLNPHLTPSLGLEPGPHWWEARALTTAPFLLPHAWRKPLGARMRTNNKLNPHLTPSLGLEPGPHRWEARALTTAPFLLPHACSDILGTRQNTYISSAC